MKKYLVCSFLLLSVFTLQAQVISKTQLIYGRVNRIINSKNGKYEIPASDVKVLLLEIANSGVRFDKSICNKKTYPSQVKVFISDSKGEYNFKAMKKGTKYRLIFCDTRNNKVYFTELQTPPVVKNVIRVPDQNIQ